MVESVVADRSVIGPVRACILSALLVPAGHGSPPRTLAALLGGHVRRPSRAALDAAKPTTRNRRQVLLSDRFGGSLTSRKVHNGPGELVRVAGHPGSLHSPVRIAAGMRERQRPAQSKLSHYQIAALLD